MNDFSANVNEIESHIAAVKEEKYNMQRLIDKIEGLPYSYELDGMSEYRSLRRSAYALLDRIESRIYVLECMEQATAGAIAEIKRKLAAANADAQEYKRFSFDV